MNPLSKYAVDYVAFSPLEKRIQASSDGWKQLQQYASYLRGRTAVNPFGYTEPIMANKNNRSEAHHKKKKTTTKKKERKQGSCARNPESPTQTQDVKTQDVKTQDLKPQSPKPPENPLAKYRVAYIALSPLEKKIQYRRELLEEIKQEILRLERGHAFKTRSGEPKAVNKPKAVKKKKKKKKKSKSTDSDSERANRTVVS